MKHQGRPRGPIKHTNPIVRAVLEAVNRSGLDDGYIVRKAGIGRHELSNWRGGYRTPSLTRLEWVLGALGAELIVREIPGGKVK